MALMIPYALSLSQTIPFQAHLISAWRIPACLQSPFGPAAFSKLTPLYLTYVLDYILHPESSHFSLLITPFSSLPSLLPFIQTPFPYTQPHLLFTYQLCTCLGLFGSLKTLSRPARRPDTSGVFAMPSRILRLHSPHSISLQSLWPRKSSMPLSLSKTSDM